VAPAPHPAPPVPNLQQVLELDRETRGWGDAWLAGRD